MYQNWIDDLINKNMLILAWPQLYKVLMLGIDGMYCIYICEKNYWPWNGSMANKDSARANWLNKLLTTYVYEIMTNN